MPLKEQEKYGLVLVEFANSKTLKELKKALYDGLKRVKKFPKEYRNREHVIAIPEDITQIRKEMKNILYRILDGKSLFGNKALKRYIEIYNSQFPPFFVISRDGNLETSTIFEMPPEEIDAESLIAFNLIKFLENDYKPYLHECFQCSKFFISKKTGENISKCKECPTLSTWTQKQHTDAQQKRRAEEREAKRAKEIHKMYINLTKHGKHGDKEALGWLELEFPEDLDLIFKELPILEQYRSKPNNSSTGK